MSHIRHDSRRQYRNHCRRRRLSVSPRYTVSRPIARFHGGTLLAADIEREMLRLTWEAEDRLHRAKADLCDELWRLQMEQHADPRNPVYPVCQQHILSLDQFRRVEL